MTTVPPGPNLTSACGRQRPQHHREFPAGYSSAGCSPAEPASASPTQETYIILSLQHMPLYMLVNLFPIFGSHTWGAVHPVLSSPPGFGRTYRARNFCYSAAASAAPKVGNPLVRLSPFLSWTRGSWSTSDCRHGPSSVPEHAC